MGGGCLKCAKTCSCQIMYARSLPASWLPLMPCFFELPFPAPTLLPAPPPQSNAAHFSRCGAHQQQATLTII